MGRWLVRGLFVWAALDAAQYVVGGVIMLVSAYALFRSPLGSAGSALRQDGKDGALLLVGLGAILCLIGLYQLATLVSMRRPSEW